MPLICVRLFQGKESKPIWFPDMSKTRQPAHPRNIIFKKKTCMACRKLKLRIVFQAKQENCITSTKHSRQDLKCPTWHACSHRERSNLKAVIVEKSEFQCSRNGFEGIRGDSRDSRTRKKGLHQCFWSKQVQFWETAPKISLQTPFEGDGQLAFANTVVHLRPQSRPFWQAFESKKTKNDCNCSKRVKTQQQRAEPSFFSQLEPKSAAGGFVCATWPQIFHVP